MVLEELRRRAAQRVGDWARVRGLSTCAPPVFTPPAPHVAADLASPWPLQAAKRLGRPPLEIARELVEALSGLPDVESLFYSNPGFVNIRLNAAGLCRNLGALRAAPVEYGANPSGPRRSILIEFVSANPTGPMHLASGRGATLGDSLARILARIGHKIGTEYYVNDAGGRVELLGASLKARFDRLHGRAASVPEGGYEGEYVRELAAQLPSEAERWDVTAFGRYAMERLLSSHKADMRDFGVHFDRWVHESELYASGAVASTLTLLQERRMTYERAGAVWLGTQTLEGAADDKDRVLVRSNGRPTYFLPDIAYHKDKYDRGWEELINVWGADHHGYVPRMKAAVAALGKDPGSLHPIIHQLVHLTRGKEAIKMSKRSGDFVTLRELLEEAGRDACRFFFSQRTANAHMTFDLELAKKQSQENPVYYVQYVHARICSLNREAAKTSLVPASALENAKIAEFLTRPEERALLVKLAWFPGTLAACEECLSPHPLANYLLELAGLFHPFYERCRIVDGRERPLSEARLGLCAGVRDAMREGLGLLGVGAPETM